MENLVYVGYLSKTHKLSGTIRMNTAFSYLEQLEGKMVVLKKENDLILKKVKKLKGQNMKSVLIDFEDINNIEIAKEILSYKVYIRKDLIEDYEEKEDLIDFKVYENDVYIGVVEDILDTLAHEILVISNEQKEILIPNIDVFVTNVDYENKKINVKTIEGMI